jgi:beta-galactosidase
VTVINYSPHSYQEFHAAHPDQPIVATEIGSTTSDRGVYGALSPGFVSAYATTGIDSVEDAWRRIGDTPYVAGGFVWTGFDYKGETTPTWWPTVNSHFGLLDMCGYPKDDAYFYKAWWTDQPLVHLLPHWNWPDRVGQPIDVRCYSNCAKVELLLNGRSLGTQDQPRFGQIRWDVPYAPGILEARGYRAGKLVAVERVETTGAAAAFSLHAERTTLSADGEDIVPVEVSIVDSAGRIVPTADAEVTFTAAGAGTVAGTGNGDPTSHEPDVGAQRRAFHGRCMVLVRAAEHSGRISLTATASGLQAGHLELTARRP